MSTQPYSYHTFLFPFKWNNDPDVKWDDFKKVLSVGSRWFDTSWSDEKLPADKMKDKWQENYAAFQYFTEPARAAIYNTQGEIVHCYEYWHSGAFRKVKGQYVITKASEKFQLDIKCIRMNVYDSGVAILVLELENNEFQNMDCVNKINEYGRRINMPFLDLDNGFNLCADRIDIVFDGEVFASEDYKETLTQLRENFEEKRDKISLTYIMKPIQKLIDGGGKDIGGYKVTTVNSDSSEKNSKKKYIKPCVDDRMFVALFVTRRLQRIYNFGTMKQQNMCILVIV
jgi:hypothetical protein